MARSRFVVEVLTPDGEVFNEEVEMVSTMTTVGSIGLLANHEPLLARLEPTELRLYRSETDIVRYAQAEGYVQMSDNHALLLVEEALEQGQGDPCVRERRERARVGDDQPEEGADGRLPRLRPGVRVGELEARLVERRVELHRPLEVRDALLEPLQCVDLQLPQRGEPPRVGEPAVAAARDELLQGARVSAIVGIVAGTALQATHQCVIVQGRLMASYGFLDQGR